MLDYLEMYHTFHYVRIFLDQKELDLTNNAHDLFLYSHFITLESINKVWSAGAMWNHIYSQSEHEMK